MTIHERPDGPYDTYYYFKGRRYDYTSGNHYQCEFCKQAQRATWNAATLEAPRYTFVCDEHFLSHCQPERAARFRDPHPGEEYTLTTIGEFLQGVEELKAIYAAKSRAKMGD